MKLTLLLILICTAPHLFAQDKQRADSLYAAQSWQEAAKAYKQYLKKNKVDSAGWFSLAVSSINSQAYDAAFEAIEQAERTNYPKSTTNLARAKTYLLQGNKEKMYTSLEKAVEAGLAAYAFIKSDTVFKEQLNEDKFVALLDQVKLNAYPCLSNPKYRHFDFWLGTWEVYARGGKVGTNVISMAEGGCAIHENYTTAGNYTGQSINYYDPIDEKWHQHWVGSGGDVYNYLETKRDSGMLQFKSKFMGSSGKISLSRLTFTLNDDGTVRQFFESSTDNGQTWSPAFDGLYKKVK